MNHKSVKRPDGFLSSVSRIFNSLASRSAGLVIAGIGILFMCLAVGFYMNHRDARASRANNALFLAEKAFESEMKKQEPSVPSEKAQDQKNQKNQGDGIAFKKLDVDRHFPETVKKFVEVSQNFNGTRAASDAQMKLGALYFDHGDFAKALELGEGSLKGDLLMAIARCQETLHDSSKARSIYDRILSELPNTEYAKAADINKAQLP